MAIAKLQGKTKIVATKVLGSPQGEPRFYRIAEGHFPSMTVLEARAVRRRKGNLGKRSEDFNRGAPFFLVAEEETFELTDASSK